MKKAFTLVELLIVIGIIGILSGILITSFGGGTESARNAKCLTNMRNLAAACHTYGMSSGYYPPAGSFEKFGIDESSGIHHAKRIYSERKGWISWNSRSAYASSPRSHVASLAWFTSCYNQDYDVREYALTNGVLWKYLSGNREVYVCPSHKLACSQQHQPLWSYVMNQYFYWDKSKGSKAQGESTLGIKYAGITRADRRLLFAEIPFTDTIAQPSPDTDTAAGTRNDCTLQYSTSDGSEYIGFNHKSGKRLKFAHVVFADGHVEKISLPKGGLSQGQARELTEWLCTGKDITFSGGRYQKLQD
jgi:prepilin-type N-terminal cleavage/methylation domain-containing protein/prepilin-type processing-associated H-X9-DG protein